MKDITNLPNVIMEGTVSIPNLMTTIKQSSSAVVKGLIKYKLPGDIDLLMAAVDANDPEAARKVIKTGIDVTARAKDGSTALERAQDRTDDLTQEEKPKNKELIELISAAMGKQKLETKEHLGRY